jgi:hypothetical protein
MRRLWTLAAEALVLAVMSNVVAAKANTDQLRAHPNPRDERFYLASVQTCLDGAEKETTIMLEERNLDHCIRDLSTLKGGLPELAKLDALTAKAKSELAATTAQLEKVRGEIKDLQNVQAIDRHNWDRERAPLVARRQSMRHEMELELERDKAELTQTQNAIAAKSKELEQVVKELRQTQRQLGL